MPRIIPARNLSTLEPEAAEPVAPAKRVARALALEIEAARSRLHEAEADPSMDADDIDELATELGRLESEFFLTGVTSEYDL